MEYIFVDDASPDESRSIIERVAAEYDRDVRILTHLENKGLPAARNTGLAEAKGGFIYHCDSDDYLEPTMLEEMYKAMRKADGIGLAGPQVGVTKRIFVIEIPSESVMQTFVNPEIIETSVETGMYNEGCLSLPGLEHEIERPLKVSVCAQDIEGKPFTVNAEGLFARAIQHENDHLNGILYIDHLDQEEKERMEQLFVKKQEALKKAKRRH